MPTMNTPVASIHSVPAKMHSSSAITLSAAAPTMERRSPWHEVNIAAGMLLTSEPMPTRPTIRPEVASDAPSSRAVSATTGRMAPLLTP